MLVNAVGKLPRPVRFTYCGHLLGMSVAVIAAAAGIRSIVISGPIFSLLGLLLACLLRRRFPSMAMVAISPLFLSMSLFAMINMLEWGPQHAQRPVTVMLLVYEVLVLSAGLWAIHQTNQPWESQPHRARWQFSLWSLFVGSSLLAIAFAAARTAAAFGAGELVAIAFSLSVLYVLAMIVVQLLARRAT